MFQFSPSHRGHLKSCIFSWGVVAFQFSPSHRGHRKIFIEIKTGRKFQFSPSHRGHRQTNRRREKDMNKFQFSPSHRGHLLSSLESAEILEFQFSPSHRGHLMPGKCNLPSNILFQFSPSHRGHLKEDVTRIDLSIVSILALAQRASDAASGGLDNVLVSILALAQRASIQGPGRAARLGFQFSPSHRGHHRNVTVRCYKSRSFNSRPRTEGISAGSATGAVPFTVSILALAQRASR